jgi:hypothetical protein
MMADFIRSLRRNWQVILAFTLVYAAIALNLGPAWVILAWFVNGCAYVIYLALRD